MSTPTPTLAELQETPRVDDLIDRGGSVAQIIHLARGLERELTLARRDVYNHYSLVARANAINRALDRELRDVKHSATLFLAQQFAAAREDAFLQSNQ